MNLPNSLSILSPNPEKVQHQLLSRYEDPEINQDVPNSSIAALADQGPSNPNLLDLTSDYKIDKAGIYVPLKIVRTINEYNTWWEFSLAFWKRLKELKDSMKHDLLDLLLELFKPIEEASEWLGGQKYCTLSLIYPTIQVLKYDYVVVEEENDE
ncbi:4082_t:CDS:2, partial [Gigaspora rosea]